MNPPARALRQPVTLTAKEKESWDAITIAYQEKRNIVTQCQNVSRDDKNSALETYREHGPMTSRKKKIRAANWKIFTDGVWHERVDINKAYRKERDYLKSKGEEPLPRIVPARLGDTPNWDGTAAFAASRDLINAQEAAVADSDETRNDRDQEKEDKKADKKGADGQFDMLTRVEGEQKSKSKSLGSSDKAHDEWKHPNLVQYIRDIANMTTTPIAEIAENNDITAELLQKLVQQLRSTAPVGLHQSSVDPQGPSEGPSRPRLVESPHARGFPTSHETMDAELTPDEYDAIEKLMFESRRPEPLRMSASGHETGNGQEIDAERIDAYRESLHSRLAQDYDVDPHHLDNQELLQQAMISHLWHRRSLRDEIDPAEFSIIDELLREFGIL